MSSSKEPTVIKVPINDFKVSSLPASVKSKWEPFGRGSGQTEKRAHVLKDATYRVYRAMEVRAGVCPASPMSRTGGPQLYRIHSAKRVRGVIAALFIGSYRILKYYTPRAAMGDFTLTGRDSRIYDNRLSLVSSLFGSTKPAHWHKSLSLATDFAFLDI